MPQASSLFILAKITDQSVQVFYAKAFFFFQFLRLFPVSLQYLKAPCVTGPPDLYVVLQACTIWCHGQCKAAPSPAQQSPFHVSDLAVMHPNRFIVTLSWQLMCTVLKEVGFPLECFFKLIFISCRCC